MRYLLIVLGCLSAIACQEDSDGPGMQVIDPDMQVINGADLILRPWIFTSNLDMDSPSPSQVNSIEASDYFWVIDIGDGGELRVTTDVVMLPFEVGDLLDLTASTVTGYFDDLYGAAIIRNADGTLLLAGQSTPVERVDGPAVTSMFNDGLGLAVELGGVIDTYELDYGLTSTHSLRFHIGEDDYEINPGESQAIQINGRNFTLTVGLVNTWDERLGTDLYEWIEWVLIAQPE